VRGREKGVREGEGEREKNKVTSSNSITHPQLTQSMGQKYIPSQEN
jgi:hypothetical protein